MSYTCILYRNEFQSAYLWIFILLLFIKIYDYLQIQDGSLINEKTLVKLLVLCLLQNYHPFTKKFPKKKKKRTGFIVQQQSIIIYK